MALTEQDLDYAARTAAGEARGEGDRGMAQVVYNIFHRVNSADFPNTVAGVARETLPGRRNVFQYSTWNGGRNDARNISPTSQAYLQAREMVQNVADGELALGTIPDLFPDSVFYHVTGTPAPTARESLVEAGREGRHTFLTMQSDVGRTERLAGFPAPRLRPDITQTANDASSLPSMIPEGGPGTFATAGMPAASAPPAISTLPGISTASASAPPDGGPATGPLRDLDAGMRALEGRVRSAGPSPVQSSLPQFQSNLYDLSDEETFAIRPSQAAVPTPRLRPPWLSSNVRLEDLPAGVRDGTATFDQLSEPHQNYIRTRVAGDTSSAAAIRRLQTRLNERGATRPDGQPLRVDGRIGRNTNAAIEAAARDSWSRAMQERSGSAYGIGAGPRSGSRTVNGRPLPQPQAPQPVDTSNDAFTTSYEQWLDQLRDPAHIAEAREQNQASPSPDFSRMAGRYGSRLPSISGMIDRAGDRSTVPTPRVSPGRNSRAWSGRTGAPNIPIPPMRPATPRQSTPGQPAVGGPAMGRPGDYAYQYSYPPASTPRQSTPLPRAQTPSRTTSPAPRVNPNVSRGTSPGGYNYSVNTATGRGSYVTNSGRTIDYRI